MTTITSSHATVEEWTEADCYDKDFLTKIQDKTPTFRTWQRKKIAKYDDFSDEAKADDRHHLNQFFIDNGVKIKEGGSVHLEGKPKEILPEFEFEMIEEGTGPNVREGAIVKINYTGRRADGTVFEASDNKLPASFKVDIALMHTDNPGSLATGNPKCFDIGIK